MIKSHTGCYAWVAFLSSGRKIRPAGGNPPRRELLVTLLGVNSNNEMDRWREGEYLLLTFDGNYH